MRSLGGARRAAPGADVPEDIRDAVSRLKRERIIATAVQLFYSDGFNNTTLEAVAEAMNVTKPFIYSHFSSKNELLAAICSRGIRASLEALQKAVLLQGTPTEKLEAMARDFMLAVLGNQAHIAIYNREEKELSAEDSETINEMRREFDRKLCALLEAGVASGEFAVDDVQITSLAIGGLVSWSYVWFRPNGRLTPADVHLLYEVAMKDGGSTVFDAVFTGQDAVGSFRLFRVACRSRASTNENGRVAYLSFDTVQEHRTGRQKLLLLGPSKLFGTGWDDPKSPLAPAIRQIKSSNVLLAEPTGAALVDFGLRQYADQPDSPVGYPIFVYTIDAKGFRMTRKIKQGEPVTFSSQNQGQSQP